MKRLLSALATAGFLLAVGATTAPATAAPADGGGRHPVKPAPATQVWATRQVSAEPGQQSPTWLRLDVEQLTPRVITADSPAAVTVSGKVVNIGDRKLTDIDFRLERGAALTKEDELRGALREPADAELVQPLFTSISKVLEPGQSQPFSFDVPLKGSTSNSLALETPGIYPILANVNGKPDYGGRARLAALSTLLPVLGVPGGEARPKPVAPAKVTALWPLVDRPRMVTAGVPGQSVLTDDDLAQSLALGGRLSGLLQAYENAVTSAPLASSLCLAIDPDLLQTVGAMSQGYQVRGRGTGKGQDEAELWLGQLRRLASGHCVIATPYADADLVSLSRAKLGDMTKLALSGASVVQQVLDVQPLPGVVWPQDGVVDQRTVADLTTAGVKSLVLDPSGLTDVTGTQPVRVDGSSPATAVRIDSLVSEALRGGTDQPQALGGVTTPSQSKAVSVQNALAVLVFRAGFQDAGQNVVIAPPRRWNAPAGEMNLFVETLKTLYASQYAAPAGLDALVATGLPGQHGKVSYPVETNSKEIPESITSDVASSWAAVQGMFEAMTPEDSNRTQPADLIHPLRLGLLRSVSSAWRGNEGAARAAVSTSRDEVEKLQSQVTVTEPNSPILLGSGDSPILVNIKNKLDVRVNVRLVMADTPGIRPKPLADQVLPANGDRLLPVPVSVLRSGRFSVNVQLTTPGGVHLGDTARVEVSSSAYGTITVVITASGAIALVLLSARRIYRRVKASREAESATPEMTSEVPEDVSDVAPEKSSTS